MYSKLLAVERTMQILELLSQSSGALGVTEIAKQLHLQKADVSRILSTMQEGKYVIQDPETNRFKLSWRFIGMALKYTENMRLEDAVGPIVDQLAKDTRELVQLAIVQNNELLFVAKAEGLKPLRVASMIGYSAPLHATAVGKVWLASLPEDKAMMLVAQNGMKAITENTIIDPIRFLEELRKVRQQGYALSWEEINKTVVGLAVPVLDKQNTVKASLVVTIPVFEATEGRLHEICQLAQNSSKILSERLITF